MDPFDGKIEELVDRSRGRIRADRAHSKLVAMGYQGSERTTRRAVAEAKRRWRQKHGRLTRPWIPERAVAAVGLRGWPDRDGRQDGVVLRVGRVVAVSGGGALADKTLPSVVIGLDRALRRFDGVPTSALTEYVPGHIFGLLCPV